MKFYQEITLIEQAEISPYFIWSKLYGQLHIALADYKNIKGDFTHGISFPEYAYDAKKEKGTLGKKLRIFSSSKIELESLDLSRWLARLSDYIHITSIKDVPKKVNGYAIYQRKSVKGASRIEREMQEKAERWSNKSGKSLAECLVELEKTKPNGICHLPFIVLESEETKKRHPLASSRFQLFIEKQQVDESKVGLFDSYGLSAKTNAKEFFSTVPDFD